jgi:hypothetical protein
MTYLVFCRAILCAAVLLLAAHSPALACACCSDRGARYVATEPMSEWRLGQIGEMAFANEATLLDRDDGDLPKGMKFSGSTFELEFTRREGQIVLSFRDRVDREGTIVFTIPKTISIFEVDPRGDTKDEGLGPSLNKEWSLTADAAGDGLFAPIVGAGQKLTLIFHGHGRGCTEAMHFTDWTLQIHGLAANVTLFGALDSAAK